MVPLKTWVKNMEITGNNIHRWKKEIRRNIISLRDGMTLEDRQRASLLIAERIIGHQWFYKAENILCFISFGSEVDTTEIINEAFSKKKKVFVPKVVDKDLIFYRIHSFSDLKEGYKSIREPFCDSEIYQFQLGESDQTLMIMPGVAFDLSRNRIGYGKGFYDRYLVGKEELHTIAIGFQCQMVDKIPHGEQDIQPYQILVQ